MPVHHAQAWMLPSALRATAALHAWDTGRASMPCDLRHCTGRQAGSPYAHDLMHIDL